MKRDTLKKDMLAANNGKILITRQGIEKAFGLGHDTIAEMLSETDYKVIGKNRKQLYVIDDVVDAFLAFEG